MVVYSLFSSGLDCMYLISFIFSLLFPKIGCFLITFLKFLVCFLCLLIYSLGFETFANPRESYSTSILRKHTTPPLSHT